MPDYGEHATIFIEWVYSHPGQPQEEYASELAKVINVVAAEERERCCQIVYGQCGSDNVAERTVRAIRDIT